jgi:hypothetical protein
VSSAKVITDLSFKTAKASSKFGIGVAKSIVDSFHEDDNNNNQRTNDNTASYRITNTENDEDQTSSSRQLTTTSSSMTTNSSHIQTQNIDLNPAKLFTRTLSLSLSLASHITEKSIDLAHFWTNFGLSAADESLKGLYHVFGDSETAVAVEEFLGLVGREMSRGGGVEIYIEDEDFNEDSMQIEDGVTKEGALVVVGEDGNGTRRGRGRRAVVLKSVKEMGGLETLKNMTAWVCLQQLTREEYQHLLRRGSSSVDQRLFGKEVILLSPDSKMHESTTGTAATSSSPNDGPKIVELDPDFNSSELNLSDIIFDDALETIVSPETANTNSSNSNISSPSIILTTTDMIFGHVGSSQSSNNAQTPNNSDSESEEIKLLKALRRNMRFATGAYGQLASTFLGFGTSSDASSDSFFSGSSTETKRQSRTSALFSAIKEKMIIPNLPQNSGNMLTKAGGFQQEEGGARTVPIVHRDHKFFSAHTETPLKDFIKTSPNELNVAKENSDPSTSATATATPPPPYPPTEPPTSPQSSSTSTSSASFESNNASNASPSASASASFLKSLAPYTQSYQPTFYVIVDHPSKTVVVCFRGTLSLHDVLVDLSCDFVQVDFGTSPKDPKEKKRVYNVHAGMYKTAYTLSLPTLPTSFSTSPFPNSNLKRTQTLHSAVLQGLLGNPGYSLTLTGHSLGAGVASLLALIWGDWETGSLRTDLGFPGGRPIKCFGFGSPGVLGREAIYKSVEESEETEDEKKEEKEVVGKVESSNESEGKGKEKYEGWEFGERIVYSVVYRDDVVPRLCLGSVRDLLGVVGYLHLSSSSASSSVFGGFGNSAAGKKNDVLEIMKSWASLESAKSAEEMTYLLNLRGKMESSCFRNERLYPPGTILLLERETRHVSNSYDDDSFGGGVHSTRLADEEVVVVMKEVTNVKEVLRGLLFSGSMLGDHMPNSYENVLRGVV